MVYCNYDKIFISEGRTAISVSSNWLFFICIAHLKFFLRHDLWPWQPQGRQFNCSFVCTIKLLLLKGPNPYSGVVEQKTAVTGAFIAEVKCMGAESFT